VILDVLMWLAIGDAAASAVLAILVCVIARKSKAPVPARTAVGIAILLTLPAAILYFAAWMIGKAVD
jgi:hypothetical protein